MKKNYLMTGNKKVMSAVLVAATMMLGLTACGGSNEEPTQVESSVVESTVESSVQESTEESTVENTEEGSIQESSEELTDETAQTRTYTMEVDGAEIAFTETLFSSENGFSIWYPADMLKAAEVEEYDGFLRFGEQGEELASFMIVPADAAVDMDEMLLEAANSYGEDVEAVVGEIMELELDADSEMTVKSVEVTLTDAADRFYAVSDGENAVLITVKATAEAMEELGVHFDRMAGSVAFGMNEAAAE